MKTFMMLLAILVLLFVVVGLGRKLCCKQKIVDGQIAGLTSLSEEKSGALSKRLMPQSVANAEEQAQLVRRSTESARSPQAVPTEAKEMLRSTPEQNSDAASESPDIVRLAAEKSQLMDDLLNEEPIPSDYGQVMVGLFRDRGQDVYTRDFAVQHIGLYAEALHRRGAYDPTSPEALQLRKALDAAADETRTIVAAAAFRALDDLAAFDPHVDARRLDSRLVACAADASASSAARVMAAQLCGERKVLSSRSLLKRLADDPKENAVVRKSSACALRALEGR